MRLQTCLYTAIVLLLEALPTLAGGPGAAGPGWEEQITGVIRAAEYQFSPSADGAWSAPNRAHGFRTRIDGAAIELASRLAGPEEARGGWRLRLVLESFGRPGSQRPVPDAPAAELQGRIERTRDAITDWYINDERGLEQGFTIANPPPGPEAGSSRTVPVSPAGRPRPGSDGAVPPQAEGPDAGRTLVLSLRIEGGLRARLEPDGQSVLFATGNGIDAVRCSGLRVTDARGTELEASFALVPGAMEIRIVDGDAIYPITVDPLMTSPAWIGESNQAGAQFGAAVAPAGDVNGDGFSDLLVGAPFYDNGQTDEGRVFLFAGSVSGPAAAPSWTAESDQADAQFGASAAPAGDLNGDGFGDVVVGAPLYDNGQTDEGRIYVYLGSASGLASSPALVAESNQAGARFGASVSTAGDADGDGFDDLVVGAPLFDNGQTDEGRAFLFRGSAIPLATAPAWTAESNQASAQFGFSVAGAGDVNGDRFADVVIGSPLFDNGQSNEGRAWLYLGSGSGPGAAAAWTAESDQGSAEFGCSVGAAGDVNGDGYADLIVGAHLFDNGETDEGRAFVYLGSASGPGATPSWTAESNQAAADYGLSVATAGDINGDGYGDVVVGAPLYKNGQRDEGLAYLYLGSAAGLAATAAWTAESDDAAAHFGSSVASAGDVNGDGFGDVIAGAPLFDNGQTDEGRAYFYYGSAAGPAAAAAWTAESDQASGAMGYSIGSAGDVNGDGFGDLFIGVPFFDTGAGADAGRVLVFHGSAGGPAAVANWIADGAQANARFGYSSASAGDVNGDGYTDLIVGAYLYDNGQTDEGRAFVYLGSPAGLAAAPAWTMEANQAGAQLGNSVASAGDVNGDGYGDVIVGAYSYDNGQADEGRAFVYLGSPAGLAATPAWTAESNQAGALFGAPVAGAGDVNGDGFSDLLVGAWQYDAAGSNTGRAYVYLGSASGPALAPAWVADGDQAEGLFGFPLSSAGDVNGDGFSDVIVGATGYDNTMTNEGRVYLYYGSAAGLSPAAGWIYSGDQDSASIGYVRAPGGDVNGDGYADIVIGAPYYNNVGVDEGRTFLFLGSASGPGAAPNWTADGNQTGALFGYASGGAGDVNGDGFADIVVGATGFDNDLLNEGRAFLYYGNGGAGTRRQPRQVRPDGATPIDVLGRSDSRTEFRLKGPGRTAAGRAVVGFQYELRPLGAPFDGAGLQSSASADSGAPSGPGSAASFDLLVSGLTPGTPYRWRARTVSRSPFFPRSPWFYLPYNSAGETDLRTAICNDNDGDGYGSPGDPTCPGGSAADCNDADAAVHPGAPELCDNIDNDCNGSVDGFATACGAGACARTGLCAAGTDSCAAGTPSPETCDNIDNDCDGTVDGFATACGTGACARTGTCTAGVNSCAPGAPSPETCDAIDNNCDGTVDGFATTCGLGPCAAAGSCVAGHDSCTPGPSSPETCDNIDNNCDGTVDNYTTTCGVGACLRTGTCVAGADSCAPGAPSPETCDTIDNNCDGIVDNAPPPAGALLLSVTKTALSWTTMAPGVHYDVVRGSIQTLHATGGNFTASTGACIANNRSQSSVGFTTSPAAGEGFWILVRGTSGGCSNGVTSYDTGAASQVGYRDAGIAASPSACP